MVARYCSYFSRFIQKIDGVILSLASDVYGCIYTSLACIYSDEYAVCGHLHMYHVSKSESEQTTLQVPIYSTKFQVVLLSTSPFLAWSSASSCILSSSRDTKFSNHEPAQPPFAIESLHPSNNHYKNIKNSLVSKLTPHKASEVKMFTIMCFFLTKPKLCNRF